MSYASQKDKKCRWHLRDLPTSITPLDFYVFLRRVRLEIKKIPSILTFAPI